MSKIDIMNSNSNNDYIADELFTELTPETAEVVGGGWLMRSYDGFSDNKGSQLAGANFYIKPKYGHRISSIYIRSGKWKITSRDGSAPSVTLYPGWNNFNYSSGGSEAMAMLNNNVGSIKKVG